MSLLPKFLVSNGIHFRRNARRAFARCLAGHQSNCLTSQRTRRLPHPEAPCPPGPHHQGHPAATTCRAAPTLYRCPTTAPTSTRCSASKKASAPGAATTSRSATSRSITSSPKPGAAPPQAKEGEMAFCGIRHAGGAGVGCVGGADQGAVRGVGACTGQDVCDMVPTVKVERSQWEAKKRAAGRTFDENEVTVRDAWGPDEAEPPPPPSDPAGETGAR